MTAKYTFFSSSYLTFTKIDHILVQKTPFIKLKIITHCMIVCVLSDFNVLNRKLTTECS